MKNSLIHFLVLLWLMPCVPLCTGAQVKHRKAVNRSADKQQKGCPPLTEKGSRPKAKDATEQEREFDRVLMGIYG
jgi:hypothetical protein